MEEKEDITHEFTTHHSNAVEDGNGGEVVIYSLINDNVNKALEYIGEIATIHNKHWGNTNFIVKLKNMRQYNTISDMIFQHPQKIADGLKIQSEHDLSFVFNYNIWKTAW